MVSLKRLDTCFIWFGLLSLWAHVQQPVVRFVAVPLCLPGLVKDGQQCDPHLQLSQLQFGCMGAQVGGCGVYSVLEHIMSPQ
jgi:hypothetical protein